MQLVPVKIKIGLKPNGSALYPNFNVLPSVDVDWSYYIDRHGSGWLYDCCGHKEEEAGSPAGQQWGMILVPQTFADEAVAAFPSDVTKLTEAEAEDFYDNKHARDFEDEDIDLKVVDAIRAKQALNLPLTAHQQDALDPDSNTRGIRKNPKKKFSTFKQERGITIV